MITFEDKSILVTGGTGCIGSSIIRKLLQHNPRVIRTFSNDEDGTFRLRHELKKHENMRYLVGDIRDIKRLTMAMENIDIIFHTAALKHVSLCEYNPFEAVKTNVLGTQNMAESAIKSNVEKVINISTDKAVNPINTMGATKLLAEKLITHANDWTLRQTLFSSVRLGNVLFSRGSVIPIFEGQIRNNKPITITHPKMRRFIMSIDQAIGLIFKATEMMKGREIFILKMPVIKIDDLADVIMKHYNKKLKKQIIGPEHGEKLYEELMTKEESEIAYETDEMYIIPPFFDRVLAKPQQYNAKPCKKKRYHSADIEPLTKEEIENILFPTEKV